MTAILLYFLLFFSTVLSIVIYDNFYQFSEYKILILIYSIFGIVTISLCTIKLLIDLIAKLLT